MCHPFGHISQNTTFCWRNNAPWPFIPTHYVFPPRVMSPWHLSTEDEAMGRRATCPVNASTKLFFLHPFVSVYIYLSASHLSNCNWMIAQRSLSANGRINAIDLRRGSTSTFKDSDDEGNKLCPANHAALNLLLSTINRKCVYFNQITFKLLAIKTCMVVAMTILP